MTRSPSPSIHFPSRSAIVLFILSLASCTTTPGVNVPTIDTKIEIKSLISYFPKISTGMTGTYKISGIYNDPENMEIIAVVKDISNDVATVIVTGKALGGIDSVTLNLNVNNILSEENFYITRTVGYSIVETKVDFKKHTISDLKSGGSDSITVAGTAYNVFKVTGKVTGLGDNIPFTAWLNTGVGIVKLNLVYGSQIITFELKSFSK